MVEERPPGRSTTPATARAGFRAGRRPQWFPQSKPLAFIEYGYPSTDRGTNQPNVFFDAKSTESATPYWSIWDPAPGGGYTPRRDDTISSLALQAMYEYWTSDGHNEILAGRRAAGPVRVLLRLELGRAPLPGLSAARLAMGRLRETGKRATGSTAKARSSARSRPRPHPASAPTPSSRRWPRSGRRCGSRHASTPMWPTHVSGRSRRAPEGLCAAARL